MRWNTLLQVEDAFVATDRETGRSRGFGFVTMESTAALAAAQEMNETDFMGRCVQTSCREHMKAMIPLSATTRKDSSTSQV